MAQVTKLTIQGATNTQVTKPGSSPVTAKVTSMPGPREQSQPDNRSS